ncbi:winged helix-turn-helix domain-containing protein [Pseudoalteromonas atlantica]|uniref:winged helix-turn-helix domain-containing protein n=1 Tax=Pseudoalteromonas atlantica TaxID=288 RepID=UPI0037362F6F
MSKAEPKKLLLNDVLIDFAALKIKVAGKWCSIEAKQLQLLQLLISHKGQAVTRDTIMDVVWPDVVVSDNSVSQLVTQLRKSLSDDKNTAYFIRTIPRVGYQLIAQVSDAPTILEKVVPASPRTSALFIFAGLILGALFTLLSQYLLAPEQVQLDYQYQSRLTSAPGAEVFLRYSPNGRYLAFSQSNDQQSQFDLAVYDNQSKTVHSIKNSGYSEEAPVWSPDGKWLAYFRYDPISCDIRVMSVANAIETWRLSPEFRLTRCQQRHGPTKLHWVDERTIYTTHWQDEQPRLIKYTLSLTPSPKLVSQQVVGDFKPLAFDINTDNKLLILEKNAGWYSLSEVDLNAKLKRSVIKQSRHSHAPLLLDSERGYYWLGDDALRRYGYDGNKQTVHEPLGFIADIAINPQSGDIAHAEGQARINLYQIELDLHTEQLLKSAQQLSSSSRMDMLPAVSLDGQQSAFISLQKRGITEFTHSEVWLKHKQRKSANLIATLPSDITPKYLLFSPNGDNLLLADQLHNIYLINTFSRRLVPIISGFEQLNGVHWAQDSHSIYYQAKNQQGQWQDWRYDIQLTSNTLVKDNVPLETLDEDHLLWQLNASYIEYEKHVASFLAAELELQLPLSQLLPSLALFKPAVFNGGVYYVLRQGHQLRLYCYLTKQKRNVFIKELGVYGYDLDINLNISSSADGTHVVFSQVDGIETDILLHKATKAARK